jgi:hypothetical protein
LEKSQVSAAVTVWEEKKKIVHVRMENKLQQLSRLPPHTPPSFHHLHLTHALGLHFKAPRTSSFYDVVAIGEKK